MHPDIHLQLFNLRHAALARARRRRPGQRRHDRSQRAAGRRPPWRLRRRGPAMP